MLSILRVGQKLFYIVWGPIEDTTKSIQTHNNILYQCKKKIKNKNKTTHTHTHP